MLIATGGACAKLRRSCTYPRGASNERSDSAATPTIDWARGGCLNAVPRGGTVYASMLAVRTWGRSLSVALVGAFVGVACTTTPRSSAPDASVLPSSVSGVVQKGPFIRGTSVTVQSLDANLAPTGQTFDVVTSDDQGSFDVPVNVTSQYVEVISSGYYFDELTNDLSVAPLTLRAVADLTSGGTVDVNLLTSMSEPLVRTLVLQGTPFAQATLQAESSVLAACGFGASHGFSFSSADFTGSGTSSAALLAASLIVEQYARSLGSSEVAELTQLLSEIGAAASDSGGSALQRLNAALCTTARSIDVAAVRTNLTAYYASVGATVEIPDFETFIASAAACTDGSAPDAIATEDAAGLDAQGGPPGPEGGDDTGPTEPPDASSEVGAGDASLVDASGPPPQGDGGLVCPTALVEHSVGPFAASVEPAGMTWWGSGYTLITSIGGTLVAEVTDGDGAVLAGPTNIQSSSAAYWPRIAFSGSEYGVTYRAGQTLSFMRTDTAFAPIGGSNVALAGPTPYFGNTLGTEAVAWSNGTWGVAWAVSPDAVTSTLYFQRFDATGAPMGSPQTLGATGLSDVGVPMIATLGGWAILGSGSPGVLYEIDAQGNVRSVPLPFNVYTGSLTSSGTDYGIAADQPPAGAQDEGNVMFVRVQVGGSVVASSGATLGSPSSNEPNVIWTGGAFDVTWSDAPTIPVDSGTLGPLRMATISPSSTTGAFVGTPFTMLADAGFQTLVAGACGWAVLYMTYDRQSSLFLEVRP